MARSYDTDLESADLVDLYASVGWTNYTADPASLQRAVRGSAIVATEWDGDLLVGLARGLSDDASIFYLQDVLVRPSHQRRGIGHGLVSACLERYDHVRQKVLLTDDDPTQAAFYTALGFVRAGDHPGGRLSAYVRFDA